MRVSVTFAKAHFLELLKIVERGERVTITRSHKPVALLSPAAPKRKLGTLRGKVRIIDPNWAAPMTEEEVIAFVEGRY